MLLPASAWGADLPNVLQYVTKWFIVAHMRRVLLSGEFDHAIDSKGRVTLPARYREYFRDGAVLVPGQDGEPCLQVYHRDAWDEFDAKYMESSQRVQQ